MLTTKRTFLRAFVGATALLGLTPTKRVMADTGVRYLDQAAIPVKAPGRVVLIAVTRAGNRMVAVGEHGVVAYSDDNGVSWRQGKVPVDVTLTAVAFATPQQGWAVGHDGVILHTNDGGMVWAEQLNGLQANKITLAAAQAAVASHDPSPGTVHALVRAKHFVQAGAVVPFLTMLVQNESDATVFGAYRFAMRTIDGGKTWVDWSLHIDDALSHNIYDAARIGGDIYLVGETGLVFRSTDGGMTYPEVNSPGPNTLFVVLPTGAGGVFTAGVAGVAFCSAAGGSAWQPVDFNTSANLTAGLVLDSGALLVGSEAGTLYISRDHGRTFAALPTPQPQAIYGLAQAPNGDVIVVGSGGVSVVPAAEFNP